MKNVHGWYLPDDDVHFTQYLEGLAKVGHPIEYQREQRERALSYCDQFRGAIDVGAHVGLWAKPLCERFKIVNAIEPYEEFLPILEENAPYAKVWNYALGTGNKNITLKTNKDNSGIAFVDPSENDGECVMIRLDSIMFSTPIDFIKVDCEGYELPVLQGAYSLIEQDQPVIIVEQKPHKTDGYDWGQYDAVNYLMKHHDYRVVDRVIDDWILKPLPKKG
jgi:FkbM family methyltransferase